MQNIYFKHKYNNLSKYSKSIKQWLFFYYYIKYLGIISEPEITYNYLTNDDKYIVICSDGVWEYL